MSTSGIPDITVHLRRGRTAWDGFRWALLGGWVVVMVAGVATMAHWSSYRALEQDLRGGVDHVTVAGPRAQPHSADAVQEVRWRSGGINHKVLVHVVSPPDPDSAATIDDSVDEFSGDGLQRVEGEDVGEVLVAAHPGLEVTRTSQDEAPAGPDDGSTISVGWRVVTPFDGVAGVAAGGLLLLTVVLLVFGSEPWRATRWAWFWLLGVPYLGWPALLILAGPTKGLTPPRVDPRLTGGKAFLLAAATFTVGSFLGVV